MNLSVRSLRFKGYTPAVFNHGESAIMSLVDGLLEFDNDKKKVKPTTAIVNESHLFARSMKVSRYKTMIQSKKKGYNEEMIQGEIIEFATQETHQQLDYDRRRLRWKSEYGCRRFQGHSRSD